MYIFEKYASDINAICAPLQQFHITGYHYAFIASDNRELRLGTHPNWMRHYYDQKLYEYSVFDKNASGCPDGFVLWATLKSHQRVLSEAKKFGLDNGITLMQSSPSGQELFFFGADPTEKNMVNFYLNHIDQLKQFTVHFKAQAHAILQEGKRHLVNRGQLTKPTIEEKRDLEQMQAANTITIQPHLLNRLTKRENMVAQALLTGESTYHIADQLSISPRTVEKHIENMKVKLNCANKTLLIKQLLMNLPL